MLNPAIIPKFYKSLVLINVPERNFRYERKNQDKGY